MHGICSKLCFSILIEFAWIESENSRSATVSNLDEFLKRQLEIIYRSVLTLIVMSRLIFRGHLLQLGEGEDGAVLADVVFAYVAAAAFADAAFHAIFECGEDIIGDEAEFAEDGESVLDHDRWSTYNGDRTRGYSYRRGRCENSGRNRHTRAGAGVRACRRIYA
jgi:hypothetical protein